MRVGYPRILVPMGKIAIPIAKRYMRHAELHGHDGRRQPDTLHVIELVSR
jgi:hypothetical protein